MFRPTRTFGKIECIVFPRTFAEYEGILGEDDPVVMTGQVNLDESHGFFQLKLKNLNKRLSPEFRGASKCFSRKLIVKNYIVLERQFAKGVFLVISFLKIMTGGHGFRWRGVPCKSSSSAPK